MKIAVIGASGKVGRLIVQEALAKQMIVTEIVRDQKKAYTTNYLVADVYQLTTAAISSFDVVVCAIGFSQDKVSEFSTAYQHLLQIMTGLKTRLIIVGGAGSLYVDQAHTKMLKDTPEFPKDFKPVANAMADAVQLLKKNHEVNWLYISPAADFSPDYPTKHHYVKQSDNFTTDQQGQSQLSYGDYALAVIDEIENPSEQQKQISLRW